MAIPTPEPGLVISYAYLWRHEHNRGQEEGRKTRPCVVILAVEGRSTAVRVTVAAITHTAPDADRVALEVPPKVKQHLGLDDERSWIVLDEVNQFDWPGFDLRPVPGRSDTYDYGFIPPKLYAAAKDRLLEASASRRTKIIPRD